MLQPVEQRINKIAASEYAEIVTSADFANLLDGHSFSSDILERILSIIGSVVSERNAPLLYQSIVRQVYVSIPDMRPFTYICIAYSERMGCK